MPKHINPISVSKFPTNVHTNCMGFALGCEESLSGFLGIRKFNLDGSFPIDEAFFRMLREVGYDVPRQISTIDEAHSNEYILMLLGSTKYRIPSLFLSEQELCWNFHVVRRELDGTWVHKPGWERLPCAICTDADWEAIHSEFGRKYILFAFTAK